MKFHVSKENDKLRNKRTKCIICYVCFIRTNTMFSVWPILPDSSLIPQIPFVTEGLLSRIGPFLPPRQYVVLKMVEQDLNFVPSLKIKFID